MNISSRIYALIRSVHEHTYSASLTEVDNRTLIAVVRREWIHITAYGHLSLTRSGQEALLEYTEQGVPLRKHPGDVAAGLKVLMTRGRIVRMPHKRNSLKKWARRANAG